MGKCAVVTGATSGFGEATARLLAERDYSLVIVGRRVEKLEQLASDLSGRVPVHILPLDVSDRAAVDEAFSNLPESFSTVDILVNSAGLALGIEPAWETDLDDWDTMIDTNIKGVTYCTRALLPKMVERNRGHIITIGSTAGNWPYPGGNVYGATKAFVQQFARNLRADLLGTKIRVTNIEPGMAETEFSNVRFKGDANKADSVYKNTSPLKAEDIAEIIVWAVTQPEHVNINTLEVMSIDQAWGPYAINRNQS